VVLCGGLAAHGEIPKGWDKFLKFNESCAITVGISSEFSGIRRAGAYYQQALLTARLGRHMKFKEYIFRFETFEPLPMYYPIVMDWETETFLHPAIREMIEWDEKYNTEYLKTLRAYLVTNKSTKESIRLLMVHQNTLMYRLQKIRELFNIDFTDGKLTLTLLNNILLLEVARPELLPLFSLPLD
jgi:DNA-binding PucR family transcriptional regulator